jgi:hypothetical protein
LWFPWTLSTYAQIIKETTRPTLIRGSMVCFRNEADLDGLAAKPIALESFADYFASSRHGRHCGTCQMVVRRAAFLEVGGFAETNINAEDHDLVMRLGTAPGFAYLTAPAVIAYRLHPGGLTGDWSRTYLGIVHLLQMEQGGHYPGGKVRRRDRRRILTGHIRPVTFALLRQKEFKKACTLYRETFVWNLSLGRLPYLAAFIFKAVFAWILPSLRSNECH